MHAWNMNYRTETLSVYTENSVIIILHMCSVKGRYDIVFTTLYAHVMCTYIIMQPQQSNILHKSNHTDTTKL